MSASEWAETLPENCPPTESKQPNGEKYYRLVNSIPPNLADFDSHRKKFPTKAFNVSECIARAASLIRDRETALNKTRIGNQQGMKVVSLSLPSDSGAVAKTGRDPHHWSWWRRASFDPVERCQHETE
jgi:hypothetical protein